MLTRIKRSALHMIHTGIARLWVQPLEDRIIPLLEKKSGWLPALLLRLASWVANAGRVAVLETRLRVVRWVSPDWSVCYIGNGGSADELCRLLFPFPPQMIEMPKIFLWQAARLARRYAKEGDLVVSEVNKILRIIPAGPGVAFLVPDWVKQVLEGIDCPLDDILADMNQTMRRNIRRVDGQGYSYVFSQEGDDFDFFYHRMYSPYISWRHGANPEQLRSYEEMNYCFRKFGGVILVKQGQEPVCGMLCYLRDGECEAMEMGVLDGRFELVKQGSNVALWWFMLNWARQQSVHRFDFGSSPAHIINGTFNFKRQWGTRVVVDKRRYSRWSFFCTDISPQLRERLNSVGWISEMGGRHYRVLLDSGEATDAAAIRDWLDEAAKCGLEGLMIISPLGDRQIVPTQSSLFAHRHSNNPLQPSF